MNEYTINWEDIIQSETPLDAVKQCCRNIASGHTLAFTVKNTKTGEEYTVDLNEPAEDAVILVRE